MKMQIYKQHDQMDCGPICLRIAAKHDGRNHSLQKLRELSQINREGVSLLDISEAAEKIAFRSLGAKLSLEQLNKADLPCIHYWR